MPSVLQAIRLYALATWVGGLLFFAFTLAPTAFRTLPGHEAGLIVGAALPVLHHTGIVCGVLILAISGLVRPRQTLQSGLVLAMLALTFSLQAGILPRMERDRAQAGGDITAAAPNHPARLDFDRLHRRSEQMEGGVLLLGLVLLALVAAEPRQAPNA